MTANIIIVEFIFMFVGFLFKANTTVGSISIKATEEPFDKILKTIDYQEQNPQSLYLLVSMSTFMSVNFCSISVLSTLTDKHPRIERQCQISW